MTLQPIELEGTWEEIVAHAAELAGRRVRVIILIFTRIHLTFMALAFSLRETK